MLKIRDDVDLKELEKFGFKLYEQNVVGYEINYIERKSNYGITIYTWNKTLDDYISNEQLILLYDLIKANLVEKV